MRRFVSFFFLYPASSRASAEHGWNRRGRDGTAKARGLSLTSLPWSNLAGQLSTGDALIDTSPADYVAECYPVYEQPPPRTNHDLINQPSGLCMGHLFCGFYQCCPDEEFLNGDVNTTAYILEKVPFLTTDPPYSGEAQAVLDDWLDTSNTAYAVPPKVLFPRVASDVTAAVSFAKEHGVEISVKNSGHSYAGSSTKAGTLLINMNKYQRYALTNETGVEECTTDDNNTSSGDNNNGTFADDLSDQPCRLATARGKPAVLRVGGGENFDKAYRAVKAFNERRGAEAGYAYHMVGGAAGTVSPMGWTWMGGLAATTMGRTLGFGVDQVLQIEAVLPDGSHVRFGPTGWESAEGYSYPRTTEVSGVCNEDDVWKACPPDINFDDLWFAFRGGGGGTWGVVLSTYLQLHPYVPFEYVTPSDRCSLFLYSEEQTALLGLMAEFSLDYFLDPANVGATSEQSNACGLPSGDPIGQFFCFGEGTGDAVVASFKNFMAAKNASLTSAGYPEEEVNTAVNCLVVEYPKDYAEIRIIEEGPHAGKATDTISPGYDSTIAHEVNQLLPQSWMLQNKNLLIEFLKATPGGLYFAFGDGAKFAHDQTTSLSAAHREAGGMIFYAAAAPDWTNVLPDMYNFTTGDGIPSYLGHNHLGPATYGPLKADPTQPCPVWFLTLREAEEMCYSSQEAIFGSESLKRLEAIKEAIDPDGMFNCFRCIANKVTFDEESTDAPTKAPTDAPTKAPTDAPTKAPTDAPTDAPTKSPTDAPTKAPTDAPTKAPTDAPTKAPTDAPVAAPTSGASKTKMLGFFVVMVATLINLFFRFF